MMLPKYNAMSSNSIYDSAGNSTVANKISSSKRNLTGGTSKFGTPAGMTTNKNNKKPNAGNTAATKYSNAGNTVTNKNTVNTVNTVNTSNISNDGNSSTGIDAASIPIVPNYIVTGTVNTGTIATIPASVTCFDTYTAVSVNAVDIEMH
jgi:hypothetical protein